MLQASVGNYRRKVDIMIKWLRQLFCRHRMNNNIYWMSNDGFIYKKCSGCLKIVQETKEWTK